MRARISACSSSPGARDDGGFNGNDFAVFRSAAEQSSFAIGNARIHREAHEKRAMENELQNAREVQRILLPQEEPVVAGFRISGTNLPARIISGDYYDYIARRRPEVRHRHRRCLRQGRARRPAHGDVPQRPALGRSGRTILPRRCLPP